MSLGLFVCRLVVAKTVSVIRRSRARKPLAGCGTIRLRPPRRTYLDRSGRESSEGSATEKGRVFLFQEAQTKTWWRTRSAQQDSVWPTGSLSKHQMQRPNKARYNAPNVCLLELHVFFFSLFLLLCLKPTIYLWNEM